MSCGPETAGAFRPIPNGLLACISDEGFRLFFSLGALHSALWPLFWVVAYGFDLPLATEIPPALWHGYEMLVGGFGAALIGFLTTAAPEWTDTAPFRGRPLWILAALWACGRIVGLLGWDGFGVVAGLSDLIWIGFLIAYLSRLTWLKKSDKLIAFMFWLFILFACVCWSRLAFLAFDTEAATKATHLIGFAFLGLLGLALARITVPVTNLILDPSETTSPFRPHPGRLHLAPGLVLLAMTGEVAGLSAAVSGFLWIAAGAAFMDRVAEAFVGQEAARSEILMLAGSSALAGLGLILFGAARLDAPWSEVDGLHLAFMGGLGLGVLAVYTIAGLLHTGRPLGVPVPARIAALLLVASVLLRIDTQAVVGAAVIPQSLVASSACWACAFLLWLGCFGRYFTKVGAS